MRGIPGSNPGPLFILQFSPLSPGAILIKMTKMIHPGVGGIERNGRLPGLQVQDHEMAHRRRRPGRHRTFRPAGDGATRCGVIRPLGQPTKLLRGLSPDESSIIIRQKNTTGLAGWGGI